MTPEPTGRQNRPRAARLSVRAPRLAASRRVASVA